MYKCQALTAKGEYCKRWGWYESVSNHFFCKYHYQHLLAQGFIYKKKAF